MPPGRASLQPMRRARCRPHRTSAARSRIRQPVCRGRVRKDRAVCRGRVRKDRRDGVGECDETVLQEPPASSAAATAPPPDGRHIAQTAAAVTANNASSTRCDATDDTAAPARSPPTVPASASPASGTSAVGSNACQPVCGNHTSTQAWASLARTFHTPDTRSRSPGDVPRGQAGRHALAAQHDRQRRGDLFAEPALRLEQEVVDGVAGRDRCVEVVLGVVLPSHRS